MTDRTPGEGRCAQREDERRRLPSARPAGTCDPSRIRITNLDLSADEYERLLVLPPAELRKLRWRSPSHPGWSVDEVVRDVTLDESYTGGTSAVRGRGRAS